MPGNAATVRSRRSAAHVDGFIPKKRVQRLVLLRDAVARGHAIGQVADVADDDLRALLRRTDNLVDSGVSGRRKVRAGDSNLGPLLKAIEAFDCAGAERELNRLSTATAKPRDVVHEVALPLMRITGERWHEGRFSIAQEHMVTELLSGLLVSLLRIYGTSNPPAKVLLATPENEHHGFGVLAAAMLTAANGLGAIHLGTNLPAREIVQAARRTEADAILLGVCGARAGSVIPAAAGNPERSWRAYSPLGGRCGRGASGQSSRGLRLAGAEELSRV